MNIQTQLDAEEADRDEDTAFYVAKVAETGAALAAVLDEIRQFAITVPFDNESAALALDEMGIRSKTADAWHAKPKNAPVSISDGSDLSRATVLKAMHHLRTASDEALVAYYVDADSRGYHGRNLFAALAIACQRLGGHFSAPVAK